MLVSSFELQAKYIVSSDKFRHRKIYSDISMESRNCLRRDEFNANLWTGQNKIFVSQMSKRSLSAFFPFHASSRIFSFKNSGSRNKIQIVSAIFLSKTKFTFRLSHASFKILFFEFQVSQSNSDCFGFLSFHTVCKRTRWYMK